MSQPRTAIKTGRASLIGGIAVAIASFVLWFAVSHELGAAWYWACSSPAGSEPGSASPIFNPG